MTKQIIKVNTSIKNINGLSVPIYEYFYYEQKNDVIILTQVNKSKDSRCIKGKHDWEFVEPILSVSSTLWVCKRCGAED